MADNTSSTPGSGFVEATTTIGTSDPLSVCDGFGLFGSTVNAGTMQHHTLLDVSPKILLWEIDIDIAYEFFLGVCGPAYAILFDSPFVGWAPVTDSDPAQQSVVTQVTNDRLQSGFFFGSNFGLDIDFSVREFKVIHWWTPWKGKWEDEFDVSLEPRFDLINVILTIILKLLEEKATILQKVDTFTPALLEAWGLFDEKQNEFASNKGVWTVAPEFTLPINLISLIPGLSKIAEGLEAILVYLRLGPTIGISIPTTISIKKIIVDGVHEFPVTTVDAAGNVIAFPGPSLGNGPSHENESDYSPQSIGIELEDQPGFQLDLGVFGQLCAFKLFDLFASFSFPVTSALGLPSGDGKTFNHSLSCTIGGGPTGFTCKKLDSTAAAQSVEVVFEPPNPKQ